MTFSHLSKILAAGMALLVLAGCSGPQVRVDMTSTANLNTSEKGEPLPVVVRVYQLEDARDFRNATFKALWKQDMRTLGDAALTRDELVLKPGHDHEIELNRKGQARYVGVMAVFRDPQEEGWRDVVPLPDGYVGRRMDQRVVVQLRGNSLEIEE